MSTPEHTQTSFADYYDMWTRRFAQGEFPQSLALHYGYVEDPTKPYDLEAAQIAINSLAADALMLSLGHTGVIADLGCGVGGPARYMARRFPAAHILAINIHEPQLNLMQQLPPKPSQRIIPMLADFTQLEIADNSLDGAYAIESSCYAPDKPAFYQGALRVMRKGARLAICDVFECRLPSTAEEHSQYQSSMRGWAVPNWHPDTPEIPGAATEYRNLTPHILPTVTASHHFFAKQLSREDEPVLRGQMEVVAGLHACLSSGMLQYGLLSVTKT